MATKTYLLGKDAVLTVDGLFLQSITDAVVRVRTQEMSVANGVDAADSTLVFRRTIEYQCVITDLNESSFLLARQSNTVGLPILVAVVLARGHLVKAFFATIHDMEEDQPLGDQARTRWVFKEWGKQPLTIEELEWQRIWNMGR